MKKGVIILLILINQLVIAQELFVGTDPASNVPANSLTLRLSQSFLKEQFTNQSHYVLMPEITYGLSKKIMLRSTGFLQNQIGLKGMGVYAKYRFFSRDDYHSHFRMAIFGRYSYVNTITHQEQIETMGQNSGAETGIIATKLISKLAISSSLSLEKAFQHQSEEHFSPKNHFATNYTLSFGRLMYPKKYVNYQQTNINLMTEFLGQTLTNGKTYIDILPAIQLIFNSQARVDLAYKYQLYSSMDRLMPNGIYLNIEYIFF